MNEDVNNLWWSWATRRRGEKEFTYDTREGKEDPEIIVLVGETKKLIKEVESLERKLTFEIIALEEELGKKREELAESQNLKHSGSCWQNCFSLFDCEDKFEKKLVKEIGLLEEIVALEKRLQNKRELKNSDRAWQKRHYGLFDDEFEEKHESGAEESLENKKTRLEQYHILKGEESICNCLKPKIKTHEEVIVPKCC